MDSSSCEKRFLSSPRHSVKNLINDQWRICLRWKCGDAFEVEIVDYH